MRIYADACKKILFFQILFGLFMFYWVHMPVRAIQPYEPDTVDPLVEPWCWHHSESLDGLVFNQDMKSQVSLNIIESTILTLILKDSIIATYYIGADVQSNNTELAIKQRGKIVARYSVPATIIAISTVLDSPQGRKILAMEEGSMAGWLYRNDAPKEFEKLLVLSHRLLAQQILAGVSTLRYQSCPGKELAATLTDMESIEYLGQYYADKINVLAENL